MKILHIAGGAAKNRIYINLVNVLKQEGVEKQLLFAAVRTLNEKERQPADEFPRLIYKFEYILKPFHRLFFRKKIARIVDEIYRVDTPKSFDLVHAHSLYSDGAVALQLRQKEGIPFVIAVRNTDINAFMKLRPDLWRIRNNVLNEAKAIFFISPAYYDKFFKRIDKKFGEELKTKCLVVPNGLGDQWFLGSKIERNCARQELKILYVGDFTKNKNVINLINAAQYLLRKGKHVTLSLVGAGGDQEQLIQHLCKKEEYFFLNYIGRIENTEKLKQIYREHDLFAMVSYKETFGMVYIEALSQGLPVVYSIGQGIDGYFNSNGVAESTDPYDYKAIAASIENLQKRLKDVRLNCITEARRFRLSSIAQKYISLYEDIVLER